MVWKIIVVAVVSAVGVGVVVLVIALHFPKVGQYVSQSFIASVRRSLSVSRSVRRSLARSPTKPSWTSRCLDLT